jgi:hypothetical protein
MHGPLPYVHDGQRASSSFSVPVLLVVVVAVVTVVFVAVAVVAVTVVELDLHCIKPRGHATSPAPPPCTDMKGTQRRVSPVS